jgi:endo-1,4-beta-xylanase
MDSINELPGLAEAYKNYFDIGMGVNDGTLYSEPTKTLILKQFSTITMGNEMKPSYLLDYDTSVSNLSKYNLSPAIKTDKLEKYLLYAKDNGLKVRFHTLVWHQQTPRWFFTENYTKDKEAPLVSKDVMLKRLENYIRQVMVCTSTYPDVIYAWDVVNEAIEPDHKQANGYRVTDNLWYQIIGEDFVEKAFEYARKYSYDDAGLFYNDYNTYITAKTNAIYNLAAKLKAKGLIDGIGMQSHILMTFPSLSSYETAVRKFAELGLEINVTELDMHNTQNTSTAFEQQADRYAALFELLVRLKSQGIANITNVTIWGIQDTNTWLTALHGETSYPLLFDGDMKPKPAFYHILDVAK